MVEIDFEPETYQILRTNAKLSALTLGHRPLYHSTVATTRKHMWYIVGFHKILIRILKLFCKHISNNYSMSG
jgi:hypothetical protein